MCGGRFKDVHKGFKEEFNNIWDSNAMQDTMMPYLKENCDSVFAVGHSLGGALASLFAAWINAHADCMDYDPGFIVGRLYTTGALAISKTKLTSDAHDDKCFPGKRIYNEDYGLLDNPVDPVARLAQKIGYKHPKVKAVRMREYNKWKTWRFVKAYKKYTS